jgi:Na+/H+ antiporter NhaD/arsenite permease-like protein
MPLRTDLVDSMRVAWRSDRVSSVLVASAVALAVVALVTHPSSLPPVLATTLAPFIEVGMIVFVGWLAVRAGVIARIAARWRTWSRTARIIAVLGLTATLSGLMNLDVAVGVSIPIAVIVAAEAGLDAGLLAIGVANVANATSFLLPTSNLTNLLVMGGHTPPIGQYLGATWIAWVGVCAITVLIFVVLVARRPGTPSPSSIATAWSLRRIAIDLLAMYVVASSLRALLSSGWVLPGGFAEQTSAGSALASAMDNLPGAVIVHSGAGLGPWTAILAMSVGANLFFTGSVATVICRRLAHESGARFSLLTFTLVGAALLPFQLAIAFVGLRLSGALPAG